VRRRKLRVRKKRGRWDRRAENPVDQRNARARPTNLGAISKYLKIETQEKFLMPEYWEGKKGYK